MSQFTCAACGGTFDAEWTDEEADAEYRERFQKSAAANEPREVVCDDCYKRMTTELPPEDFEKGKGANGHA